MVGQASAQLMNIVYSIPMTQRQVVLSSGSTQAQPPQHGVAPCCSEHCSDVVRQRAAAASPAPELGWPAPGSTVVFELDAVRPSGRTLQRRRWEGFMGGGRVQVHA